MINLKKLSKQFNTSYKFPQEVLRDKSLTPADKIVAFHLFRFINDLGTAGMPKIETIASDLNITQRTVISAKSKLISKGYLSINKDNTYNFKLAGITYTTKDIRKKDIMNMLGNFIKVPLYMLYLEELTSAEKLYLMMFFDYFFEIIYENDNISFRRKRNIKLTDLHNLYKDYAEYDAFKKALKSIKTKTEWIDWKTIVTTNKDGNVNHTILGGFVPMAKLCFKAVTPEETKKEEEYKQTEEKEEEYIPTEEEIKERDRLLANIRPSFKTQYETQIINNRIDEQIIWLKRLQIKKENI